MPGKYSIKDLETLTGVKAHTLRIWEQRYDIVKPHRTETNIRYYTDDDLKKLLNISLLNDQGVKISRLAKMRNDEIAKEVEKCSLGEINHCEQINGLIKSMIDMDEICFERILSNAIIKQGLINAFNQTLIPFLNKVGVMWQTDSINPSQEHFISNIIRQKVIAAIDSQTSIPSPDSKKFLLFLPNHEWHELSLLVSSFIVRSYRNNCIYLGQSVPFDSLVEVVKIKKPDFILTVITHPLPENALQSYIQQLADTFTSQKIILSGAQLAGYAAKLPKNVSICPSLAEFEALVAKTS